MTFPADSTAQPERASPASGAPLPRRTRWVLGTIGALLLVAAAMGVYQSLTRPREQTLRVPHLTMQSTPHPLPDLGIRDADGKPIAFDRFRGKVVLLNLWAAWCGPCRTEMPALDRLQAKHGGPRFEVVALSTDAGGAKAVKEFYDSLGIQRLAVYIEGETNVLGALGAPGIPTTLLVDPEGREIGRYVGAADWESEAFERVLRPYLASANGESKG
jgi:thiol-disulfide isomerase/thioredoxin